VKRLPLLLVGLFLAITLARVASYTSREMSAGYLGWVYSVGLGVAVYASAYWTRNATTRKAAVVSLVFFVLVDALFNFSEVWLTASLHHPLTIAGAAVYGLFPTLATALLGWMQTSIAKLPPGAKATRMNGAIYDWITAKFSLPAKTIETEPAASEPEPEPIRYICVRCGYAAKSQNGLNAHAKTHRSGNGYHPELAKTLEEK
jgi:hypothetical protein